MCACVCMHARVCVCTYVRGYVRERACVCVHVHMYVFVARGCACVRVHSVTGVCMCVLREGIWPICLGQFEKKKRTFVMVLADR